MGHRGRSRIDLGEAPLKRGKADPKTLAHLVDLHVDDMSEVGKAPRRSKQFTLDALKAKRSCQACAAQAGVPST